jgi:hypothetical protein
MMPGARKKISAHVMFLSVIGGLPYKRKTVTPMTKMPYKKYIHRSDCVCVTVMKRSPPSHNMGTGRAAQAKQAYSSPCKNYAELGRRSERNGGGVA